jgi:hypothetical protein
MTRPYSSDLRERVVASVSFGRSCRVTAALFGVSVASVVRWSQRYRATGSSRAKPMGGRRRRRLLPAQDKLLFSDCDGVDDVHGRWPRQDRVSADATGRVGACPVSLRCPHCEAAAWPHEAAGCHSTFPDYRPGGGDGEADASWQGVKHAPDCHHGLSCIGDRHGDRCNLPRTKGPVC